MRVMEIIKDRLIFIAIQGVLIMMFGLLLSIQGASFDAVLLICLTALVIAVVGIILDVYKKKKYYKKLYLTLEGMEKKQLISEVIEKPDFYEGQILYDVLKQVTKAMNDEICHYKHTQDEYKEYIEQWIHEVKLPISCIKLICENNRNDITNSINDETKRISSYVDQALFYARSTNVEKDYAIRKVMLDKVIKDVLKNNSKELINYKTKITIEKLECVVLADAKWLEFILGQIVSNSIKYRKSELELTFFCEEMSTYTILHVKDNGVGIPEKDIDKIFDKGFTGINGRKFGNATGIGLYLCKKLCDKMHLELRVNASVDKGTIMSIVFPNDKEFLGKDQ